MKYLSLTSSILLISNFASANNLTLSNNKFPWSILLASLGTGLIIGYFSRKEDKKKLDNSIKTESSKKKIKIVGCAEKSFEEALTNFRFSSGSVDHNIHKREENPFNTSVIMNEQIFKSGINEYIKGLDSIANLSHEPIAIEWGTVKDGERLSIETTLHGISVDSNNIFNNAILDGDKSAAASFTRAEKYFKNFSPNITLNKNSKSTKIRFDFYTKSATRQNTLSH